MPARHMSIVLENLVKIGPVHSQIIGLSKIILKEREETLAEYLAHVAGMPSGLNNKRVALAGER